MADYDDTNRGAAFTPFPTQQMILQGKLNVEGADKKVMLVQRPRPVTASLSLRCTKNWRRSLTTIRKGNESAPDYSGPLGDDKRLAGWKKMKDGKPYMSFQVSDKMSGGQQAQQLTPCKVMTYRSRKEVFSCNWAAFGLSLFLSNKRRTCRKHE